METREQTEAREKKLVDDTKRLAQSGLRKLGINITNPLAGLDSLPTTEESLDPDSLKIHQDSNKPIEQLQGFAKEGLQTSLGLYGAALSQYGTVGNQPRNMINITDQVEEIVDMHPSVYKRAGSIYKHHEGGISWKQAIAMAKLPQTSSPEDLANRFMQSPKDRYPDAGNVEGRLRKRKGESEEDYANRVYNEKFEKINLTDEARLEIETMLDSKDVSQKERRNIKMGISNPNYSPKSYTETRIVLAEEFLDGLEFLGLDQTQIEAHHIASLRHVSSLFIGLPRSQFRDMLKLIYDEGIPTGNDPNNLMAIQKKAHVNKKDNPNVYAVHTYLNEQLGLYGEKLVGDYGSKIKDLSVEERKPMIKKFAAVVKGSYPVAEKAIRAVLDQNVMDDSPEALVDATLDIDKSQLNLIKKTVNDYIKLQLTAPNHQALLDSIFGGISAGESMSRRGIKPRTPIQNQLLDLGKKPKKSKKKPKDIKPGTGAYWDIESE